MRKNIALLAAELALMTALACNSPFQQSKPEISPSPLQTPTASAYSPTPAPTSTVQYYCYIQGFINGNGQVAPLVQLVQTDDPIQRWDELLCNKDKDFPYLLGISLPSTWDGMKLSVEDIARETSLYGQNHTDKWLRVEVWRGPEGKSFPGFVVATYIKPPQPGRSIAEVPDYAQLVNDLHKIIAEYARQKGIDL